MNLLVSSPELLQAQAVIMAALAPFRERFEQFLTRSGERFGEPGPLREACIHAIGGEAKRLRPALTYMVAEALGHGLDVGASALMVECLHTATLITDDFGCMDDASIRRGRPCCHKVFGEAVATLASYVLIAVSNDLIAENADQMALAAPPFNLRSGEACRAALHCAAQNAGGYGLSGGQYEDLFGDVADETALLRVYRRKTCSLFEIALVTGWVYGGGELEQLPKVRETAYQLGVLFQTVDDVLDEAEDAQNNAMNAILLLGRARTYVLGREAGEAGLRCLQELELRSKPLEQVFQGLLLALQQDPL